MLSREDIESAIETLCPSVNMCAAKMTDDFTMEVWLMRNEGAYTLEMLSEVDKVLKQYLPVNIKHFLIPVIIELE